jgi:hypothetical protein
MKKPWFLLFWTMLVALLLIQSAQAADELEVVLQGAGDSVTPVFMPGHEGEVDYIAGFTVSGVIALDGFEIGMYEGEVILKTPPLSMTAPHQHGMLISTYDFPFGTFDLTSEAVFLNSSSTPSEGDGVFAWAGSLSNGTADLEGIYGLTSGTGIVNQFTGATQFTEVLRLRFGY